MLGCHVLPGLQISTTESFGAAEQSGFGCSSEVGVWLVRGDGPFHRHLPSHQESLLLLSFQCPHGTRRDKGGVLKLLCWLSIPNLLYFAFQNSVLAVLLRNLELVLAGGWIIVNKFCCSHVAWEVCFWRKKKNVIFISSFKKFYSSFAAAFFPLLHSCSNRNRLLFVLLYFFHYFTFHYFTFHFFPLQYIALFFSHFLPPVPFLLCYVQ